MKTKVTITYVYDDFVPDGSESHEDRVDKIDAIKRSLSQSVIAPAINGSYPQNGVVEVAEVTQIY